MKHLPQPAKSPLDLHRRLIRPEAVLLAGVVAAFLTCAGLLLYGAGRGLDLTDEIFYLVWTRDPRAYELTYQPFGYLLHPLFRFVRGDLQLYRLAGFAIAAAAGAFLGLSLAPQGRSRAPFLIYGALAALSIYYPWIVTPSYNSAANVGALLTIGGVLNSMAERPSLRIAGAAATGAGLYIAAFSKPPLFLIAGALVLVALLGARTARKPLIAALMIAAALILLTLSPAELGDLVRQIVVSQHVLALPNTPAGLPAKLVHDWRLVPLPLTGAVLTAGVSFALRWPRWSRWSGYAAIALSLFYIGDIAVEALDGSMPDFIGLALICAAAGYAGLLRGRSAPLPRAIWLLLAAPLAVALGTFNNQWAQLNFSMAFPFLAAFMLASADPMIGRRATAQALAILGPIAVMLLAAEYPYSLPASIFEQQVPVAPPLAKGSVRVDPETAEFVRSARGLAPGVLLIDLSGMGPGIAAVLGARPPIIAWLNPATPAWPDVVWSRLSPAERERAWFIGPIWPQFDRTAPAEWFLAHKAAYCARALPPMTFWGEQRSLELWRPCVGRPSPAAPRSKH